MENKFVLEGTHGDAFIRLTSKGEVELIFGESSTSVREEKSFEEQEIYKIATQFALMLDSYMKNSYALDDLMIHSESGSIPRELLDSDLLPISLTGCDDMNDLTDLPIFDLILDDDSESKQGSKEPLDNVIQFRKRKNDEDK
tara:strand:+ start:1199 stop:1624 length:426 start_codon:yes stop_codon:yes gene_type:complete